MLEVSETDLRVVITIKCKEDSHNHGVRIPVLEFRSALQEVQSGVRLEKHFHHGLEIIWDDVEGSWFR